jgi:hypothetical protein
MNRDLALRLLTIAVVLGLGGLGLAQPDAAVTGGVPWLAFLFFVLSGFGWFVVRATRIEDADFGLRAAWGLAAYLAVIGPLVMLGICSKPVVLGLIAMGASGFAWREAVTPAPLWRIAVDGVRQLRANPLLGYLPIVLTALALIRILGAIVAVERNPWDDDISYVALVKRLLDVGDQIEPFSFRRLGAYGGQVALQALGAVRGTLENPHLIDQGLCFGLCLLLVIGYARELGRVAVIWIALPIVALLVMPDISINTASYWSGCVCFLAIYRTLVRHESTAGFALAGLVAAATCTLRQSYLPATALFLAFALASRLQREAATSSWSVAWRNERRLWLVTCGIALVVLVPWCIAAFLSNGTFLFPFMQGTWNHGLSLAPTGWSWVDKLSFLITCVVDAQPFVVLPIVFPLLALTRDSRQARPLAMLFLASTIGFLILIASFTGSDSYSLSRYAFGYLLPLLLVFVLEVGNDVEPNSVQLPALGRWVLLAALLIQIAFPRDGVIKRYKTVFVETAEQLSFDGRGNPEVRVERARYAEMQAALPEGARVAVLVDDPGYLDFARNEIFNLDTPGYASPGSQLPLFSGAEPVRAYFLGHGIRYLAFVRGSSSEYMYRRGFWLWRIFHDVELFQVMSAYIINTLDTFDELAKTTKVIYERDGLVVVDLDGPHAPAPQLDPAQEATRREAWMAELAKREGLEREWALTSRRDLIFADGISGLTFDDLDRDPKWYDVFYRDPEPVRGVPVRWLHKRGHLRVTGSRDMHLVMRGRVNLGSIYTRPRLDVSVRGELLASVVIAENGEFTIDVTISAAQLRGWADVYLVFNTIGTPERDVRDLRVARLDHVTWEPR